jgi:hypothetical protein
MFRWRITFELGFQRPQLDSSSFTQRQSAAGKHGHFKDAREDCAAPSSKENTLAVAAREEWRINDLKAQVEG